jgi:ankyrin repeat domain-containing protein 17
MTNVVLVVVSFSFSAFSFFFCFFFSLLLAATAFFFSCVSRIVENLNVFNFKMNISCHTQELAKKCQQSMEIIVSAKDRQAAEANKIASILLEELDKERETQEKPYL